MNVKYPLCVHCIGMIDKISKIYSGNFRQFYLKLTFLKAAELKVGNCFITY